VLLRLAYLAVTNAVPVLRLLLPMSDRAKDAEIVALRHKITVLERQLHGAKVRFASADRPRCCIDCPATCCTGCGCWCARRRCCAGIGT
jgi:hypothetical protein